MKDWLKSVLKYSAKSLGFRIIRNKNYDRLIYGQQSEILTYNKNELLSVFFKTLIDQGYHPESVYDIGANKGTWTKECLKFFPDSEYYLFEPQKNLKEDIDKILKEFKNLHLFSVGVGNLNTHVNFTLHSRDDSCSFIYDEKEAKENGYKQVLTPIVKLEDFVKENNLIPPALLKIDAEGLDIEVLKGADSLLKDVEVIMIEVGVMNKRIENSALKTLNYLDNKGFRFFEITDINRPFEDNILWLCEFVFIKKEGILDKDYSIHLK